MAANYFTANEVRATNNGDNFKIRGNQLIFFQNTNTQKPKEKGKEEDKKEWKEESAKKTENNNDEEHKENPKKEKTY